MNPMLDGYGVGLFVQEMKKAEIEGDTGAIVRAARKFLPKAKELEAEYLQLRKEEIANGKTTESATAS